MALAITPALIATLALDTIHNTLGDIDIHYEKAFGTQKVGNTVTLNTGQTAVLDNIADIRFRVSDDDLALTADDFNKKLLAPAVEALALNVRRNMQAAGEGVTLVSAPLDLPTFDDRRSGGSRDGLSVLVVFDEPEDGRRVVHVDVLYGFASAA